MRAANFPRFRELNSFTSITNTSYTDGKKLEDIGKVSILKDLQIQTGTNYIGRLFSILASTFSTEMILQKAMLYCAYFGAIIISMYFFHLKFIQLLHCLKFKMRLQNSVECLRCARDTFLIHLRLLN